MGVHLVLDASIRNWAFLPIMMATFLVGLIRMYISQAVGGQGSTNFSVATKENLVQLQAIKRARALQAVGTGLIPPWAWKQRIQHMTKEGGVIDTLVKASKRQAESSDLPMGMPMQDPSKMTGTIMKSLFGFLPNIALFMWVSNFFKGSVVARVPVSLNERFRAMLQQGVNLVNLDVSYVSSFSFYILCFSGLSGIMQLIMTQEMQRETDPTAIEQQAATAGMPAPNPLSMLMGGGDGGSAATAPLEKERQALTGARHKYLLAVSDKAVEDAACATLRAALQSGALRRA